MSRAEELYLRALMKSIYQNRWSSRGAVIARGRLVSNRRSFGSVAAAAFVLCLMAFASVARAQVDFEVAPTVPEAELGARFDVILRPQAPDFHPGRIVDVGFAGEVGPQWHVVTDWQPSAAPAPEQWIATLQAFEPGEQELPPVLVIYEAEGDVTEESLADAATIEIRSVLEGMDEQAELRPARLTLPVFPRDWTPYYIAAAAAAGALALLALMYLVWRKRRQRDSATPFVEPTLPPAAWALAELSRRRELPECKAGDAKEIATHAAEVIRLYLGRRYDFHSMEMTTYEALQYLQAITTPFETQESIESFLYFCDFVKFSDQAVPRESLESLWRQAAEIVATTTPENEQHDGIYREKLRELRSAGAAV